MKPASCGTPVPAKVAAPRAEIPVPSTRTQRSYRDFAEALARRRPSAERPGCSRGGFSVREAIQPPSPRSAVTADRGRRIHLTVQARPTWPGWACQ
jgi:hypothetical protein